jgi:hypothetical protein
VRKELIMNAAPLIAACLFAAVASSAWAGENSSSNDSKCSAPNGIGERRACEKAKEGPEALRRFVERTRMIYGLHYWDFAPRTRLAAQLEPSTIAQAR